MATARESAETLRALRLVRSGIPARVAAQRCGIAHSTVVRAMVRHGVPAGPRGRPRKV